MEIETKTKPRDPVKGGRAKGTPNKTSATAKENIQAVFVRLGSTAAMAKWAMENQTEFYKIYARLIPIEQHVAGANGEPLVVSLSFVPGANA